MERPIKLISIDANDELKSSVGTPMWAFNTFRSQILTSFLNFLQLNECNGIDDLSCSKIKIFLGELVNLATNIPDGSIFRSSLYSEFKKLQEEYSVWNDVKGQDYFAAIDRRKRLSKLQCRRHVIAKKTRIHAHILEKELDCQLVESMYSALIKMLEQTPNTMTELSYQLGRFGKKLHKIA